MDEKDDWQFVNQQGKTTLIVNIICDYDCRILALNARFPGSCHESYVYRNSAINMVLEQLYESGEIQERWLLGDSAFPLLPWLLTPFNKTENKKQSKFNKEHRRMRNKASRCIGLLKTRFRCLCSDNPLKNGPVEAINIINSCVVLHNFLLKHEFEFQEPIIPRVERELAHIPLNQRRRKCTFRDKGLLNMTKICASW